MRSALALGLAVLPAVVAAGELRGGEAVAAPPLPWREPAPPARMFLQLPFGAPSVVEAGTVRAEAQLSYANSILVASSPSLTLDVDMESVEFLGFFRYGLWPGVEVQLGVPAVADYGGILDGPVQWGESAFGATSMPGRLDHPRGLARFRLNRPDGSGVRKDGAGAGLGDVWAGLKARLADQADAFPETSLHAVVKAPTGRPPYGSGEMDLGASVSAGWRHGRAGLWLQLDAIAPTGTLSQARFPTRVYGAAQLGAALAVSGAVTLHAQWATHLSPFARTGLAPLDETTHYLVAGSSVSLSSSLALEAAAAENVFSPAWGADFTLLLGLRATH